MPYGFEIDKGGQGVMLMRTYDGKGARSLIHGINGRKITELDGDAVQAILDKQREIQGKIEFLLSSGEVVTFYPNSAPFGWNTQTAVENA